MKPLASLQSVKVGANASGNSPVETAPSQYPNAGQRFSWKDQARYAGLIFAVIAAIGYCYALAGHLEVLAKLRLNRYSLAAAAFGVGIYPAIYGLAAGIWIYSLRCLGAELPWRDSAEIGFLAQFGKYLPGNVAHHIARVIFAKKHGVSAKLVLGSMLIETVCLVGCGGLVALIALTAQLPLRSLVYSLLPSAIFPYACFVAVAVALVIVLIVGCQKLSLNLADFQPFWLVHCTLLTGIVFLIHGLIAQVVLAGFFEVHAPLLTLTGVFAFAWVAGFLTPGAPAGIGVRETVLAIGLTPICTPGIALGLAAVLRLTSTFGDGLTYTIGRWLARN